MTMEEVTVPGASMNGNGRNESGKEMIQMKFVHLSDLYIGKRVNEFPMLEDQKYILKKILSIVDQEKPSGVLTAKDIHDKPVPSAEAMQVSDTFLTSLAGRDMPVFVISGNHDNSKRLAFGTQPMAGRGVYVSLVFGGHVEPVRMSDQYESVPVYMLLFAKSAVVRRCYPDRETETFDHAVRCVLRDITGEDFSTDEQNVPMAHQFVVSTSARNFEGLSTGGLGQVNTGLLWDFGYVALGHTHGPQKIGREAMRYCGTPLKYSLSEVKHKESVAVVELFEKGSVSVSIRSLHPLHDMREIRDSYSQVTDRGFYAGTATDDYLHITSMDEEDILDAIGKLWSIYPNIMKLDYDNWHTRAGQIVDTTGEVHKPPVELFGELYELQNSQPVSGKQKEHPRKLVEGIWGDIN